VPGTSGTKVGVTVGASLRSIEVEDTEFTRPTEDDDVWTCDSIPWQLG
jgi:hypothetical protein